MNKVKPLNVGLSLSATVVVLYILCALFVWMVPGGMEPVLGAVAHSANLDPLFEKTPAISLAGVLTGTTAVAVYSFVAGALFGWIYNAFVPPETDRH